jgi:hypothetical protein
LVIGIFLGKIVNLFEYRIIRVFKGKDFDLLNSNISCITLGKLFLPSLANNNINVLNISLNIFMFFKEYNSVNILTSLNEIELM